MWNVLFVLFLIVALCFFAYLFIGGCVLLVHYVWRNVVLIFKKPE